MQVGDRLRAPAASPSGNVLPAPGVEEAPRTDLEIRGEKNFLPLLGD